MSFSVFLNGEPFIIDSGRKDYLKSNHSLNYLKSISHSVFQVNDLSIQIPINYRHFFPLFYRDFESYSFIKQNKKNIEIDIKSSSFERLNNISIYDINRKFKVYKDRIVVIDNINASRKVRLINQFIFNSSLKFNSNDMILDSFKLKLKSDNDYELLKIFCSKTYGEEEINYKIFNDNLINFPIINKTEFIIKK